MADREPHHSPHHPSPEIDISSNRRARKWSLVELVSRTLWEIVRVPMFSWSPRPLWIWRRVLLRSFGARIGQRVHIHPTVRIAIPWTLNIGDDAAIGDGAILYGLGPISIGPRTTVSQYAHLCAGSHDYRDRAMTLTKPPITIGSDVWICADAFIGPGVKIADRAIVGARSVVIKDVGADEIVGGHPAELIGLRQIS